MVGGSHGAGPACKSCKKALVKCKQHSKIRRKRQTALLMFALLMDRAPASAQDMGQWHRAWLQQSNLQPQRSLGALGCIEGTPTPPGYMAIGCTRCPQLLAGQQWAGQMQGTPSVTPPPPQPELLMATPPSPTLNKFSLQGVPNCQLFYSTSINRNCKEKKKPSPIAMERAHFQ